VKAVGLLAPVAALALGIGWLSHQRSEIIRIEEATAGLRARLAVLAMPGRGGDDSPARARAAAGRAGAGVRVPNWQSIARRLAERRSIFSDPWDDYAAARLQQDINSLPVADLTAALDTVATLDVPADVRLRLEAMLLDALSLQDPALALRRYGDRIGATDDALRWPLRQAFRRWLGLDPAAAQAWFDGQLAAGAFVSTALDGRHALRNEFEATLVSRLMASDPPAAGRRIAEVAEDQRRDVLEQAWGVLESGSHKAYAAIVRQVLAEQDQREMMQKAVFLLTGPRDTTKVDEFLAQVDASPGERTIAARTAATCWIGRLPEEQRLAAAEFGPLRDWLAKQAPAAANTITGEVIGANPAAPFEEAARLVGELHAADGGDDLLAAFLASPLARQHAAAARPLAEGISAPALRKQAIEGLGGSRNR
jgi:hypothetical protein